MIFEKEYIYHIYNQGNNKQKIFFNRENYLFFLKKIKLYILPYADIFAWCLMPNHFHLMILINKVDLARVSLEANPSLSSQKLQTINQSIGIMLRSYTNAINKQENRTGSLFRKTTKAECVNCPKNISPAWFTDNGITKINISLPEKEYPQICFEYIHQNPVKARLVKKKEDWEFSSARDYANIRDGKMIDMKKANEYIQM